MIANPNPPDFFVPTAYLQSATAHWEMPMTDPHCQAFIEAIADVLVYLAQLSAGVPKAAGEFVRPAGSGAEWNLDVEGEVVE